MTRKVILFGLVAAALLLSLVAGSQMLLSQSPADESAVAAANTLYESGHYSEAIQIYQQLVDQGVTFVGHGLKKDFNMINIHVPADQIVDTVNLFHLPGQRMIGLAFLVKHLLGAGIQDSSQGHDSIEDAHGALLLYKKYRELKMNGTLSEVLNKLYEIGHSNQWK